MNNIETRENLIVIPAISGVFVNDDNQVLLLRRTIHRTYNPSEWDLMGGDILPGEKALDTLKRDAKEKLGVRLTEEMIEDSSLVMEIHHRTTKPIRWHIFICRINRNTSLELDPNKYDMWGWYGKSQFRGLKLTPWAHDILMCIK